MRRVYENILKHVETIFPQYIDELRGIAAGSKIPFFKVLLQIDQVQVLPTSASFFFLFQLFLLHIDELISGISGKEPHGGLLGSTSVLCDQENKVSEKRGYISVANYSFFDKRVGNTARILFFNFYCENFCTLDCLRRLLSAIPEKKHL